MRKEPRKTDILNYSQGRYMLKIPDSSSRRIFLPNQLYPAGGSSQDLCITELSPWVQMIFIAHFSIFHSPSFPSFTRSRKYVLPVKNLGLAGSAPLPGGQCCACAYAVSVAVEAPSLTSMRTLLIICSVSKGPTKSKICVRMASRPLMTFPFRSQITSGSLTADLKIEISLLSKPMRARYNASEMASRSLSEVRIWGCCDMLARQ